MTTALQIITDALGKIGVLGAGDTMQSEDAQLALAMLNGIVDAWSNEPYSAYTVSEVTCNLNAGDYTKTIGPGQQIDVARPMRLEVGGFTRQANIDRSVDVWSYRDYNEITLKSVSATWPQGIYYDGGFPVGNIYMWPKVGIACTLHLMLQVRITQFDDLATDYSLPPGHKRTLGLCLAQELAPVYGRQLPPAIERQAANAKRLLKRSHVMVPDLRSGLEPRGDWWVPPR